MDFASNFNEDMLNLLHIFPEELWIKVTNLLRHPQDLCNLHTASPYFAEVLMPSRTLYLFPQVLRILDNQNYLSPNLISTSSLQNLRLVNFAFKTSVNTLLESRPHHSQFSCLSKKQTLPNSTQHLPIAPINDPAYPFWFRPYNLEINQLERILQSDILHHYSTSCPTPSRHLELMEIPTERNRGLASHRFVPQRYRTSIENLLISAGPQFWHCQIYVSIALSATEWYKLITHWVKYLPNLKTLCIISPHTLFKEQALQEPNAIVTTLKFPTLPNLQLISLEWNPNLVANAILKENPHVNCIQVLEGSGNLRKFSVTASIHPVRFNICIKSHQELCRIPSSWKLEAMKLEFDTGLNYIPLQRIFEKVEEYGGSLKELEVELPKYPTSGDVQTSMKPWNNMGRLRKLGVKLNKEIYLDFLVGLGSLEELNVRGKWIKGKMESLEKGEGDGDEGSIWRLIPSLKKVRYQRDFGGDN